MCKGVGTVAEEDEGEGGEEDGEGVEGWRGTCLGEEGEEGGEGRKEVTTPLRFPHGVAGGLGGLTISGFYLRQRHTEFGSLFLSLVLAYSWLLSRLQLSSATILATLSFLCLPTSLDFVWG